MKIFESLTFSCGVTLDLQTKGQVVVGQFEYSLLGKSFSTSAFANNGLSGYHGPLCKGLNFWNIQTSKVGPDNIPSSSSSLFYLFYYRSSNGSYWNIIFSVPGLSERTVKQEGMTNGKWYAIKVEQRLSGSLCVTTIHLTHTEIFNEVHTCGSYSTATTRIWASGNNDSGHISASGPISHFRFVWL